MDRKIQKLKNLVDRYFHTSKEDLLKTFGKASSRSDYSIWFYNRYRFFVFKDEIAFIFEEGRVVDIIISEYIFWIEVRNIFYYENGNPEYKVLNLI